MIKISNVHTVNGHKYRDIVELDFEENPIWETQEVLTRHCGWVPDGCDPSFSCNKCDNSCVEYQKWEKFYEEFYPY